ncbi:MAG: putative lipid II flippase FtsW [Candidatus Pacebacteria bacterium]|nr:putative lipid II flippase FtsW [Candidatus Paceibacterota bacterium]
MLSNLLDKSSNRHPDYILLGIIGTLVAFGILILSSVSAAPSFRLTGDTYYFLKHQIFFGLLPGLVLGYLAYRFNLSLIKKYSFLLLIFTFILMVLVFLPAIGSKDSATADRWLNIGGFSFQPSELLKLSFILYLATWLKSRSEKKFLDLKQTFFAFLMVLGSIALLLFFQSNASMLGIIFLIAIIMYFSMDMPLKYTAVTGLVALGGVAALIKIAPYRINRWLVFLDPDKDPMGIGYQLKQSLIAVGSGGLFGVGLGMSTQKLGYLPQTISDSIFAVFAEEMGFVGGIILIALFLIFAWRVFRLATKTNDKFYKLAAVGISSWIIIQTFVNIGAMIGLMPLTGVPLPFISAGGSALTIELIGMGILLNISKHAN